MALYWGCSPRLDQYWCGAPWISVDRVSADGYCLDRVCLDGVIQQWSDYDGIGQLGQSEYEFGEYPLGWNASECACIQWKFSSTYGPLKRLVLWQTSYTEAGKIVSFQPTTELSG